jgi:hypothetical protein
MADELDAAINRVREQWASAKAQADEWLRRAELLQMRLEGMEEAAKLRPGFQEAPRVRADAGGSRGRQPGAISKQWRRVLLAAAARYPDGAGEAELTTLAHAEGLHNARPRDVRGRMAEYENHGYVETAIHGWRVTPYAVAKFGSDSPDEGADQADDEMEAADAA